MPDIDPAATPPAGNPPPKPPQPLSRDAATLKALGDTWDARHRADRDRAAIAQQLAEHFHKSRTLVETLEARYHDAGQQPATAPTKRRPLTRQILTFMAENPGDMWNATTIAAGINAPVTNVRGTLQRLIENGQLQRPAVGVYALLADASEQAIPGGDA